MKKSALKSNHLSIPSDLEQKANEIIKVWRSAAQDYLSFLLTGESPSPYYPVFRSTNVMTGKHACYVSEFFLIGRMLSKSGNQAVEQYVIDNAAKLNTVPLSIYAFLRGIADKKTIANAALDASLDPIIACGCYYSFFMIGSEVGTQEKPQSKPRRTMKGILRQNMETTEARRKRLRDKMAKRFTSEHVEKLRSRAARNAQIEKANLKLVIKCEDKFIEDYEIKDSPASRNA